MSTRRLSTHAGVMACAVLVIAYIVPQPVFEGFDSANEYSRVYLTMALVEHGAVSLNPVLRRYGPTIDMARRGQHVLSDKAPGTSLLMAAPYAAYRLLADAPSTRENALRVFRVCGVLPVAAVMLVLLWKQGADLIPDTTRRAGWLLAAGIGTPLYPYGLMVYSHLYAAVALAWAWRLMSSDARSRLRDGGIGLLLGVAVLCEYTVAPIVIIFLAYALTRNTPSLSSSVAVGGPFLLVLALLGLYHHIAFGDVLATGYTHKWMMRTALVHETGVLGFTWPRPDALWGVLGSPARGLFFWSPLLLLALPGWMRWRRRNTRDAMFIGGAVLTHIVLVGMFIDWPAGWSCGPRHLTPVVPFLALAVAHVLNAEDSPAWVCKTWPVTAAMSIILMGGAMLTFPHWPGAAGVLPATPLLASPLTDIILPFVARGEFSPTAFSYLSWNLVGPMVLILAVLGAVAMILRWENSRTHVVLTGGMLVAMFSAWGGVAYAMRTPPSATERYVIGTIHEALGHPAAADAAYREALSLNPPPDLADHVRRTLQRSR